MQVELLDPALWPLYGLLLWPTTKSAVFAVASAVSVWSRNPQRRAAARRLLAILTRRPNDPAE